MDSSAYLSQLISLLPPGDALAREPGSVLERLLSVPAAELARVDGRVEALLLESDPARTTELLEDWERALGLPDVCYPNFQFSRASRAWYFDGAGVLREAAVDEPRYLFDAQGNRTDAVVVEAATVNHVRQIVANTDSPGAWQQFFGLTPSLTVNAALAPDGRFTAARVRWIGPDGAFPFVLLRIPTSGVPASTGCMVSFFVFARSVGNAQSVNIDIGDGPNSLNILPQITAGAWRRVIAGPITSHASNQFLDIAFENFTVGAIDLDIWGVQVEAGTAGTSLILPTAPATLGPATRAADQLYIATIQERRQRILARLIERFEPTPAAIIGLAARLGDTVTLTEFRPHTCEDSCEAPVVDEPWAHAFQIAGASQVVVESTCEDHCETPLSQWRTGAYECAIRRFAPAHTVPIFTYA